MSLEDAIKTTRFQSKYHRGIVNILYCASLIKKQHNKTLKEFELTIPQFNVLRILRGSHPTPATIRMIAERMIDENSNASRVVDKLKSKGLVSRFTSELDRRLVDINITEKGLQILAEIDKVFESFLCEIQHSLSEAEVLDLNALLDKFEAGTLKQEC